jgi:hypothetical protein
MVCHNCQQPGHYARECPLPPATCIFCHASDHDTEEFPTLLGDAVSQDPSQHQWVKNKVDPRK